MGMEIEISTLDDMCDLMCDNRIPQKSECRLTISLEVIEDIINEINEKIGIVNSFSEVEEYYVGKKAGLESALKTIQEKCGVM